MTCSSVPREGAAATYGIRRPRSQRSTLHFPSGDQAALVSDTRRNFIAEQDERLWVGYRT